MQISGISPCFVDYIFEFHIDVRYKNTRTPTVEYTFLVHPVSLLAPLRLSRPGMSHQTA